MKTTWFVRRVAQILKKVPYNLFEKQEGMSYLLSYN